MARPIGCSATMLVLAALITSCHRAAPATAAAPSTPSEQHCWWTAYRTDASVDTVASRFRQAYVSLGLTITGASRVGDTAWVNAYSATAKPRAEPVGARMVAYRMADSTRFRSYVVVFDPSGKTVIGSCLQIGRKAAVRAIAPRGMHHVHELEKEAALPVWRRRP
jgi:hypothetical protein